MCMYVYVYYEQFIRAGAFATGITAGFVVSTLYKVRIRSRACLSLAS